MQSRHGTQAGGPYLARHYMPLLQQIIQPAVAPYSSHEVIVSHRPHREKWASGDGNSLPACPETRVKEGGRDGGIPVAASRARGQTRPAYTPSEGRRRRQQAVGYPPIFPNNYPLTSLCGHSSTSLLRNCPRSSVFGRLTKDRWRRSTSAPAIWCDDQWGSCQGASHGCESYTGSVRHLNTTDALNILREVAPQPLTTAGEALVKSMCDQMITHAAMLIYSDPSHSHNLTCYLSKSNSSQAMTHGSNGWMLMPVNIVFPPMVRRAINLLFDNQPMASVHFTEDSSAYRTIMEYLCKKCDSSLRAAGRSRNQRSPNSSGRNDYHVVGDYRNRSLGSRGVTPMNLARSYSLLILPLPCTRLPVFASYRPYWFSFQP